MLGYLLAMTIGFSLGLLGGGGSILTVPILVYVMDMDPKVSIALSLAIVGMTSLVGVFGHYRKNNIHFRVALTFAPFAMIGTFLGAKISQFMSGSIQLILFACIMLLASVLMIRGRKDTEEDLEKQKSLPLATLAIQAIIVGIVTGLVGVGGGFLIVPALVLLSGLSMKKAVGTSLFIISLNSFSGFMGYLGLVEIPWPFLFKFSAFSAIGIFIGIALSQYVSQPTLKKIFGIFLIFMGLFILYKNREVFQSKISSYGISPSATLARNQV
ncbi:MAG: permease [Halobacteriovoraceae bacterium]|nr:permease [Halobacteriovoraceae bacterium]